jgi:hypothetical protein
MNEGYFFVVNNVGGFFAVDQQPTNFITSTTDF